MDKFKMVCYNGSNTEKQAAFPPVRIAMSPCFLLKEEYYETHRMSG